MASEIELFGFADKLLVSGLEVDLIWLQTKSVLEKIVQLTNEDAQETLPSETMWAELSLMANLTRGKWLAPVADIQKLICERLDIYFRRLAPQIEQERKFIIKLSDLEQFFERRMFAKLGVELYLLFESAALLTCLSKRHLPLSSKWLGRDLAKVDPEWAAVWDVAFSNMAELDISHLLKFLEDRCLKNLVRDR